MAIINVNQTSTWFQRFKGTAATGDGSGSDVNNPLTHLTFIEEVGEKDDAAATDPAAPNSIVALLKALFSIFRKTELEDYTYIGPNPVVIPAGTREFYIENYGVNPTVKNNNLSADTYYSWKLGGDTYQPYEAAIHWQQRPDGLPLTSTILVEPNPLDGRPRSQTLRVSCSAPTGLTLGPPPLSLNSTVNAYKTAVEGDGGSIEYYGLIAINNFINAIETAGILAKLDVLWLPTRVILPQGFSNSAELDVTVRRCIKGTTLAALDEVNFTNAAFTGLGVKGNGTSILRTDKPLNDYSGATGISYGFYSRTAGNQGDIWGTRQGNNFSIWPKWTNGDTIFEFFGGSNSSAVVSTGAGFLAQSLPPNSSTSFSWVDNAKFQDGTVTSPTFSSDGLNIPFFGAIESGGYGYRSTRECTFAFLGTGLSEGEMGTLATEVLSLATQLGW